MTKNIGNYARHAQYWDWSGYDRTEEHEYWLKYAAKYGKNVLIPMCALGETGAYLAERGMTVTAFDITPEMIEEGKKRFADVPGLQLQVADVCNFHFEIEPVDFCYSTDFGHLLTREEIKKALVSIAKHMRLGGCLVIETRLRIFGEESSYSPLQKFHPLSQNYPGIKVWKTGQTRYEAETGRTYISQTFYAQDAKGQTDSFEHAFYLQSYYREEWLEAFKECGYQLVGEYSSRDVSSWQSGDSFRIFEIVKSDS
ncbi:MAG: class I SAM-dependent methyltransferase [Firmicutes bacterium]|jgi:SAM-dependent methyltransferase|nr:class I SAM-dependent methyltransferase [Bacillota bacterium]